jgi:hypothetical protein
MLNPLRQLKKLGMRKRPAEPGTPEGYDQLQSELFTRLPVEIRLQIFDEVLGYHRIHVKIMFPKMPSAKPQSSQRGRVQKWRHCICLNENVSYTDNRFWDRCNKVCLDNFVRQSLDLNLLFTCRKA